MAKPQQPRRTPRVFIGELRPTHKPVAPSDATKARVADFQAKYPGTEISYGPDGRVSEIVNHDGFAYSAGSPEHLSILVQLDQEIRDLCELDREGAITTMRYVGAFPQAGKLGISIASEQVHEGRGVHAGKITLDALDDGDDTWSVWRIVNTTETLPVDTEVDLSLTEAEAIKEAEQAVREARGITDTSISCELAEDEGGYTEQYNRPPDAEALKPIQRIYLRFVAPGDAGLAMPVEVIVDHEGKVVFGRDLNCDLAAKAFLMEPTAASVEEAAKQVRVFEIDPGTLITNPQTGKRELRNRKVEVYYDPQDRGNANKVLVEKAGETGFTYEFGSVEFAAVVAFVGLNRCVERHARTGSRPSDVIAKAYVGLEKLLGQRITDNAAYYPSARVIGFGIRVRGVVPKGRHLLVTYDVIYHEWGHKEHHEIQMQTGRRITGPFWAMVDEHFSDVYSYLFGNEDILEDGHRLGIELTLESCLNEKGELATIAFGNPIRVMESEWTYPEGLDENAEEHDGAEKLDAPFIHTAKVWIQSEYNKAVKPEMTEIEKRAVLRAVVHKMDMDLTTICKSVVAIIKENRPNVVDLLRTLKLVARRNYGADIESYFHQGYTVRHKIPDGVSA